MSRSLFTVAAALVGPLLALAGALPAETLEEVMKRHQAAMGGSQRWQNVDTMRWVGARVSDEGGIVTVRRTLDREGRIREELTVAGEATIVGGDGRDFWIADPGGTPPRPLPAERRAEMALLAQTPGRLLVWRESGGEIELVGRESLDGTDVFHLRLSLADGATEHHYLATDSLLPLRIERRAAAASAGRGAALLLGDYRRIGGLTLPYSVETVGRDPGVARFQKVAVDLDVDEAFFSRAGASRPPEPLPPPPPEGWSLYTQSGNDAALTRSPNDAEGARILISEARNDVHWQIAVARGPFPVRAGREYLLRLRARADAVRPLTVSVAQARPPWRVDGDFEEAELSPLWTTLRYVLPAAGEDGDVEIRMLLGGNRWAVEISEVSLIELGDGTADATEPASR